MEHDTSSMAHEPPSYPSPTGHQMGEGTHPFYSSQQPIPSAEDMSLQTRLSREVPPNMTESIGDGQDLHRTEHVMQGLSQAQMSSPQQLAQGGLDSNQDSSYGDGSAKKRTKVSRACDECRRKKVRDVLDGIGRGTRGSMADCLRSDAMPPLNLESSSVQAVSVWEGPVSSVESQ